MSDPNLPTENTGPSGTVAEELGRARRRLIESRARRLQIGLTEAAAQLDAERRASSGAPTDREEEAVFNREEKVLEVAYLTPDCLDPHEVQDAIDGSLESDRLDHAGRCLHCRTLLQLATPAETGVDAFLSDTQAKSGDVGRSIVRQPPTQPERFH